MKEMLKRISTATTSALRGDLEQAIAVVCNNGKKHKGMKNVSMMNQNDVKQNNEEVRQST